MWLNRFLKQTCVIEDLNPAIVDWNVNNTLTVIYQDVKCFLYIDRRSFSQNQRAIEDQNWTITLMIQRDKNLVRLHNQVTVTDPETGPMWVYRVSRIDVHRSFSKIGWITLILTKVEDGES